MKTGRKEHGCFTSNAGKLESIQEQPRRSDVGHPEYVLLLRAAAAVEAGTYLLGFVFMVWRMLVLRIVVGWFEHWCCRSAWCLVVLCIVVMFRMLL